MQHNTRTGLLVMKNAHGIHLVLRVAAPERRGTRTRSNVVEPWEDEHALDRKVCYPVHVTLVLLMRWCCCESGWLSRSCGAWCCHSR